jgi:hypothetical protein
VFPPQDSAHGLLEDVPHDGPDCTQSEYNLFVE